MGSGGRVAYVVSSGSGTVTPIVTATDHAGPAITVGRGAQAIAIAPGGKTAYVTVAGSSGSVVPVNLATDTTGRPIPVGVQPHAIAITPDGRTAFVLDWGGAAVTPVDLATGHAGRAIRVGGYPSAIAIAPAGNVAYVASYGSDTVTPISVAGLAAGHPVRAGQAVNALAVTPDGGRVLAVGGDSDSLTMLAAGPGLVSLGATSVGYAPTAVAVSRSGRTAYVVSTVSGTVTPVTVGTGRARRPVSVGRYSYPTGIRLDPSLSLAIVLGTYANQVELLSTRTDRVVARVGVGGSPVAVAIAP